MTVIAIVGSAKLGKVQAERAEELIRQLLVCDPGDNLPGAERGWRVISGECTGVDRIAESVAKELGVWCRGYPPAGRGWRFFRVRNLEMASVCSVLWALRSRTSRTYGSGWTADRAEGLGKVVWRTWL